MDAPAAPGCLRIAAASGGAELDADLVADRCWLLGATAVGELGEGGVEVGFGTVAAAEAAAGDLGRWRPGLAIEVVDATPAMEAALEAWRLHVRPHRVGRLLIQPAWSATAVGEGDREGEGEGEKVVSVDPGRAFGFDHPSTRACLEAVDRWAGPGVSVLDVGCGSGVLAVAAAVLGAGPVVAVDAEPGAVAATAAAATANGVAVQASTAAVAEVAGTFDLVLANIGRRTLVDLAPAIAARVDEGGRLVLAGLLVDQVADVTVAYEAEGLTGTAVGEREGWASPIFLRKSTTAGA